MNSICPVCQKKQLVTIGKLKFPNAAYSKNSKLVKCAHCSFAVVNPLPNEKQIAKIYSGQYHYRTNRLTDYLFSLYLNEAYKPDYTLATNFKKRGRVLDVGAGRGDFIKMFDHKWEKWAHDPYLSNQEIAVLKQKIGKHVNVYSKLKDYPKNYYDLVILRNIVEHTAYFEEMLSEATRRLKKGGVLFIRTPNMDSLDFKVFANKWWVLNMSGHIAFQSKKSIKILLTKNKLDVIIIKPDKRSSPKSLFRSLSYPNSSKIMLLLYSVVFRLLSPILGEGGDMVILARK